MSQFDEFENTYKFGKEMGGRLERKKIKAIIEAWASERDLGIDALMAKIDGKPVIIESEFEIPDWYEEFVEIVPQKGIYKELGSKQGFRAGFRKLLDRL